MEKIQDTNNSADLTLTFSTFSEEKPGDITSEN